MSDLIVHAARDGRELRAGRAMGYPQPKFQRQLSTDCGVRPFGMVWAGTVDRMLIATRVPTTAARKLVPTVIHYRRLRAKGITRAQIAYMVAHGHLLRVRKGRYVDPAVHPDIVRAARLGTRLDCVSLLRSGGVFVYGRDSFHVQATRGASRLPRRGAGVVCHWRETDAGEDDLVAGVVEALAQACICQEPRFAIATLDSAWHLGLVDEEGIDAVFQLLPRKCQALRSHVNRHSEAGTETLVRLAVRALGHVVEVQVEIAGVGRVDLLVDGWLIIECDSREFHSSWEQQRKDRRRDAEAAKRGYITLRLIAEDILFHREWVLSVLKGTLAVGCIPRPRTSPPKAHPGDR